MAQQVLTLLQTALAPSATGGAPTPSPARLGANRADTNADGGCRHANDDCTAAIAADSAATEARTETNLSDSGAMAMSIAANRLDMDLTTIGQLCWPLIKGLRPMLLQHAHEHIAAHGNTR